MRVISGDYRGRRLQSPEGTTIRPTSDRVKEALFSMISNYVPNSNFLDLFAGSGAIGIEALSRGSNHVTFVDNGFESIKILNKNIEALGIDSNYEILNMSYLDAIHEFVKKSNKFDIVFIDPPYKKGIAQDAVLQISKFNILSSKAIIIVEHDTVDSMKDIILDLEMIKQKKYGSTMLSIYSKL